jgi:type II secretory ATPase GspE/PulE/Tfp pilus assembly ATPase PilB-like protein
MGIEPYLVASSLRAVLAQRLVRKVCKHCKEPDQVAPKTQKALRALGFDFSWTAACRGKGCPRCRNTGYAGRVGVYELLIPTDALLEAVNNRAGVHELRRLARAGSYTTLLEDGLAKVAAGLTSVEEVLAVVARTCDTPVVSGDTASGQETLGDDDNDAAAAAA